MESTFYNLILFILYVRGFSFHFTWLVFLLLFFFNVVTAFSAAISFYRYFVEVIIQVFSGSENETEWEKDWAQKRV